MLNLKIWIFQTKFIKICILFFEYEVELYHRRMWTFKV